MASIVCPKCNEEISVDQALTAQIETNLKLQFEKHREQERENERKSMLAWKAETEQKFKQEKEQHEATLKQQLETKLKKELLESSELETKTLKEELEQKTKQINEARELELKFRQERNKWEDEKKAFELDKQRQLDEEREKIRKSAEEHLLEQTRLRDAEKDKQISDMRKTIEELQLKANLTSQQLQGEVLELEIEELLKSEFPYDEIAPVGKGIRGGDITHKVFDTQGRPCGIIIWETKRTKNWDEKWIQKLKDDMRNCGADVALLVSSVLPQGTKHFAWRDGIYVTSFDCLLSLAYQIRQSLIQLHLTRMSAVGKNEKMEILYNYLSSNQFIHKMEAIVEAFSTMKSDLDKEKRQLTQIWAKREKQIERVIANTLGMHGDLQGLMGSSLPDLKSLEISTVETVETFDSTKVYRKETTITGDFTPAAQGLLLEATDD